jgi:hypothetical protein
MDGWEAGLSVRRQAEACGMDHSGRGSHSTQLTSAKTATLLNFNLL